MNVLGIILARAGSKGLPDKCVRELLGRPVIAYTFEHAKASKLLTAVVFSTDSEAAKAIARQAGIEVIDRPAELARDTATVDAAARHAVEVWERRHSCDNPLTLPTPPKGERSFKAEPDVRARMTPLSPPLLRGEVCRVDAVALLYGNIPVRADGLIDRAIEHFRRSGADSVRSVAPVSKQHPDWVHRLDGDRMVQFRPNSIYRRQDLEPLYYHDGAVAVVTRAALFGALDTPDDHQSFLGRVRRAIVCRPEDAVDIDGPIDLYMAEAVLRGRSNCRLSIVDCRMQIAGRAVGVGEPVFIVAEAGVNHNGCVETALRMVNAAAEAGADAVKFQMFRATELTTADAPTATYQREHCGAKSQREMLAKLELTADDLKRIARRCEEVGIALVITPFGVEDIVRIKVLNASTGQAAERGGSRLAGNGGIDMQDHCSQSSGQSSEGPKDRNRCSKSSGTQVAAIKIASTDLTNGPLLDAAMATGLPLIVSTGAATAEEIGENVERLVRGGAKERLVLLHCVSCYPTRVDAVNLRAMRALRRRFGVPVGLSDHTTSAEMGGWAVATGACLLEKHFTLDRAAAGPDHAMSLTPLELKEYVRHVRQVESALGSGTLGMSEAEAGVREVARKSVVAAVFISAGTRITSDMLALKRPGTGIAPDQLPSLIGREAVTDIPGDAVLSWQMVR